VTAVLPGGTRYENVFMQFMRMRWAKITEIRTLEDNVVLRRALDAVAAAGVAEARAAPITDDLDVTAYSAGSSPAASAQPGGQPGSTSCKPLQWSDAPCDRTPRLHRNRHRDPGLAALRSRITAAGHTLRMPYGRSC
jgi:hypothetical protein